MCVGIESKQCPDLVRYLEDGRLELRKTVLNAALGSSSWAEKTGSSQTHLRAHNPAP